MNTRVCNNMTKHFLTIPLPYYSRRISVTDCSPVNNRVLGYNVSAGGLTPRDNMCVEAGSDVGYAP